MLFNLFSERTESNLDESAIFLETSEFSPYLEEEYCNNNNIV